MIEYELFYYLDVQKTASTYVKGVFGAECGFECLKVNRHKSINEKDFDQRKLVCLSVRDPVKTYVSLYKYGVDKQGMLYKKLSMHDLDVLYEPSKDGFVRWLKFMLNVNNSRFVGEGLAKNRVIAKTTGFLTYRIVKLSIVNHKSFFKRFDSLPELREAYKHENIVDHLIRAETVDTDILKFVELLGDKFGFDRLEECTGKDLKNLDSVLTANVMKNVSKLKLEGENEIYDDPYVRELILSREWVYKVLGYE